MQARTMPILSRIRDYALFDERDWALQIEDYGTLLTKIKANMLYKQEAGGARGQWIETKFSDCKNPE